MMNLDWAFLASRKYKTSKFLDGECGATIGWSSKDKYSLV
jgi:hypothetical protein